MIRRHVEYMRDQNKIRTRRDAIALQNRGLAGYGFFERLQMFSRLNIEGDLDDGGQCAAKLGGI